MPPSQGIRRHDATPPPCGIRLFPARPAPLPQWPAVSVRRAGILRHRAVHGRLFAGMLTYLEQSFMHGIWHLMKRSFVDLCLQT